MCARRKEERKGRKEKEEEVSQWGKLGRYYISPSEVRQRRTSLPLVLYIYLPTYLPKGAVAPAPRSSTARMRRAVEDDATRPVVEGNIRGAMNAVAGAMTMEKMAARVVKRMIALLLREILYV